MMRFIFVSFLPVAAYSAASNDAGKLLVRHSIDPSIGTPFTFPQEWKVLGTAVPSKTQVHLSTGPPNRFAHVLSKEPLQTNDFEVKFTFSQTEKDPVATAGVKQGFAFWYTQPYDRQGEDELDKLIATDASLTIPGKLKMDMQNLGYGCYGGKGRFDGYGLLFGHEPGRPEMTRVAARTNQGNMESASEIQMGEGVPIVFRGSGVASNPIPVEVRIRFRPNSIRTEVRDPRTGSMTLISDIPAIVKPGGILGFTSSIDGAITGLYDSIAIQKMTVTNFDTLQSGESSLSADQIAQKNAQLESVKNNKHDYSEDIRKHTGRYEHEQMNEEIRKMARIMFKMVSEEQPRHEKLKSLVESLSTRLTALEKMFQDIKKEVSIRSGHDLEKEFEKMKDELKKVTTEAMSEAESRRVKMESLGQNIENIKSQRESDFDLAAHVETLNEHNRVVLDALNEGHRWSFGISCLAIFLILAAGIVLITRFRKWEKKHIL